MESQEELIKKHPLEILFEWAFWIDLNANDMFHVACADAVRLSADDMWLIKPIIEKHGDTGVQALMGYVRGQRPLRCMEGYDDAIKSIEELVASIKPEPTVWSIEDNQ